MGGFSYVIGDEVMLVWGVTFQFVCVYKGKKVKIYAVPSSYWARVIVLYIL